MIDFYAYKPNGQIVMTGYCPEGQLQYQSCDGATIAEGKTKIGTQYRSDNGALTDIPPRPDPNFVFDHDSKQWVDPRALSDVKASKWNEIKAARDATEYGGFVWDESTFDSDQASQQKIMGAVQLAGLDPQFSVDWTLADNSVRTLDATQMTAVGVALGQHVNAQHVKARGLRQQIEAATTKEAVEAIAW